MYGKFITFYLHELPHVPPRAFFKALEAMLRDAICFLMLERVKAEGRHATYYLAKQRVPIFIR